MLAPCRPRAFLDTTRNTAPEYPSTFKDDFPELVIAKSSRNSGVDGFRSSAIAQQLEESNVGVKSQGSDDNRCCSTVTAKASEPTWISPGENCGISIIVTAGRAKTQSSGDNRCCSPVTAKAPEQICVSLGKDGN
jgi:hypothetical protein